MGPLVPFDILGTDFNFIAAALIGFLFGYVLEQAGFSNSRKLAGVFYGYDFVVLRVFMTAGITAAAGLVFMDHMDMINLDYLYINPNFLWAGIVGGLIMGLGFIIGGYCPGTSLTGAAIGKIDAMFFVGGAALGILLFGETFPLFKDLYYAADGGSPLIHETLGISRELFVGLFSIMAIILFIVVGKIEKKPSEAIEPVAKNYGRAKAAIVVATLLAIITILLPDEELYSEKLADTKIESTEEFEAYFVDPIDVAFDNFNKLGKYFLIDVRDTNSYKEYCITNASNFPVEKFDDRFMSESFETNKQIVLYANDTETALKMKVLLADEGIKDLYILRGGLDEFKRIIYNTEKTNSSIDKTSNDSYDFLVKYRGYLNSDSKLTKPILKNKKIIKVIKVEGGC